MTSFMCPKKSDGILGVSVFWNLLCIGQIKLGKFQPMLQKTHLGWIVSGDIAVREQHNSSICCFSPEAQLHDELERFWRIEEVDKNSIASKDEENCETHFRKTHHQDETGRFTVSFLFKGHPDELGESCDGALKRLYKLEQRFNKDSQLKEDVFIVEYIMLNHMTVVNENQEESLIAHYIPHHPVVTTINDRRKLRVVFDASAKTSSGKSLNDILLVGPTIQQTLFSIVLRFRQYQHVLTADVIKIYRQVNLIEEQRNLQWILWRSSSDKPVQAYKLNTVIYGISAAPFMTIKALHQAAHNACTSHPDAAQVIIRDFYVADLLMGHDDLDQLRVLKNEIMTVLKSAGFELSKWKFNKPKLFQQDTEDVVKITTSEEEVKTFGLLWAPNRDSLQYQVTISCVNLKVTKRTVLSVISQIFDSLGLIGLATVKTKIILQRLWQLNVDWDESLPMDLHHK